MAHSSTQIFQVSGLLLGNTEFQLPPNIFYWVQVWRLARLLQDLEMFLTEPLLSCPGCVFQAIAMLEDPAMTHLQCSYQGKEVFAQNLTIHGPIHPPLNMVQFAEKHRQSMMFPPPCYSIYQKVLFWFYLTTWPSPMPLLDHPDGHRQI